jgi:PIN domain nuclease of toxin-antitoxin system
MAVVLDTSAVVAVLLGEPGHDAVSPLLREAAISTVNLAEIATVFTRRGHFDDDIREMIAALELETIAFDAELAMTSGLIAPLTRQAGLSLADRACLALAKRLGARVLTTDRVWARVATAVGVEIEVIR